MTLHSKSISCSQLHGDVLATGSKDGTTVLWDIVTSSPVVSFCYDKKHDWQQELPAARVEVTYLKLHSNLIAIGHDDGYVSIFNSSTGKFYGGYKDPANNSVVSIAFSTDKQIIIAFEYSTVVCFNLPSQRCKYRVSNLHGLEEIIKMDCNPLFFVTSSYDKTLCCWEVETCSKIYVQTEHQDYISTFKLKGGQVVSCSGTEAKSWYVLSPENSHEQVSTTLYGHQSQIYCVDFNDNFIAAGASDSTIIVWNSFGNILHRFTSRHVGVVRSLFLNGDFLVSGGDQKCICVWNVLTGKFLNQVHRNPCSLRFMHVNDNKLVVVSHDDKNHISVICYW